MRVTGVWPVGEVPGSAKMALRRMGKMPRLRETIRQKRRDAMSWDWKKAMSVADDTPGASLAGAVGAKRSPAAKTSGSAAGGPDRSASISWRPAGLGMLTAEGNSVELQHECEPACPFCRGRGELAGGSVCPVCNGDKKVHVTPPSVRCAFCGGQGQKPPRSNMSCWVCKGKGVIPVSGPVQTCPECGGKGKKACESLYCPRCRGVGVVAVR